MGRFEVGNKLGGRKVGSRNKIPSEIKETFRLLLTNNLEEMQLALDKVKQDNPAEFVKLVLSLASYVLPKAQTDHTLTEVAPQVYNVSFTE